MNSRLSRSQTQQKLPEHRYLIYEILLHHLDWKTGPLCVQVLVKTRNSPDVFHIFKELLFFFPYCHFVLNFDGEWQTLHSLHKATGWIGYCSGLGCSATLLFFLCLASHNAFFRRVQVLWSLFRFFCRSRNLGRYMLFSCYCMLYSMAWCSLGAAKALSVKWPECEPDIREIHVGLSAEAAKCPELLWRPHSLIYSRWGTGGGGGDGYFVRDKAVMARSHHCSVL
jgi:hypothetical protein